ncbi:MAG: hypothetical protein KGL35_14435 [Bradyrhizobium sp.]|nr:hypothetical protein [Bradyrhizobium sp.]
MDSLEQAKQELQALFYESRDLEKKLASVNARVQKIRQFVRLGEELRLAGLGDEQKSPSIAPQAESAPTTQLDHMPPEGMKTTKEKVAWACAEILADGKPRHTRDLVGMLPEWNVEVGGTNKLFAVSAILSADDRFKPSRKVGWSLASYNARPESVGADSGLFVHSADQADPTP